MSKHRCGPPRINQDYVPGLHCCWCGQRLTPDEQAESRIEQYASEEKR